MSAEGLAGGQVRERGARAPGASELELIRLSLFKRVRVRFFLVRFLDNQATAAHRYFETNVEKVED